ncbi:MAG: hypothetical protein ACXV5Q_01500 [Frankiaceae bacterium]
MDDVRTRLVCGRLIRARRHEPVRPAEWITWPVRVAGYGQPERTQRVFGAFGLVEAEPKEPDA